MKSVGMATKLEGSKMGGGKEMSKKWQFKIQVALPSLKQPKMTTITSPNEK